MKPCRFECQSKRAHWAIELVEICPLAQQLSAGRLLPCNSLGIRWPPPIESGRTFAKKTRCTSLSYKTIGSSSWLQHAMPLYFFRTFSRIVHPKKSAKASNQFIVFCSTLMCESWGCSSEDVSSDPLEIRNIRNQNVVWLPDSTVHCLGILSAKLLNHVTRSGHIIAHNDSQ